MSVMDLLKMHPTETGAIDDTGIISVKSKRGSMFFVATGSGYMLIDAGSCLADISKEIASLGIDSGSVTHVFLTHSDADHLDALPLFKDATIFISEDEVQLLDGTTKRSPGHDNNLPQGIDTRSLTKLFDGQELSVGGRQIKCIKAPGHTIGSMVYLVDGKYLFTGDAFQVRDGVMSPHPFTMDDAKANETIGKLYDLIKDSELVLTTHYGYFKSSELSTAFAID